MRIMLTGAGGFLGSRLLLYYQEKYEVFAPSRRELDFTCEEAVTEAVGVFRPDVLIHCGAISDVGACERDPEGSMRVNVEGTRNLARACGQVGARMVMCSSDQVYFRKAAEGEGREEFLRPHREEERCNPLPLYGRHKLLAEEACLTGQPDSVILRLTWMYGELTEEERKKGRKNLAVLLEELYAQRQEIKRQETKKQGAKKLSFSETDYRGVTDVGDVVRRMEDAWKLPLGIYNFGSPASGSMYECVRGALESLGMGNMAEPSEGNGGLRNLGMDPEKTARAGIRFPDSAEGLRRYLESLGACPEDPRSISLA